MDTKQPTSASTAGRIPSELDDEADDADLQPGLAWAYPCRLLSCPYYGKSWLLRSNFLLHLHEEREAHGDLGPQQRRGIELAWRYAADPNLPPRAPPAFRPREDPEEHIWSYNFRDDSGKMIHGRGTMRQMEAHRAFHNERLCRGSNK